MTNREQLIQNVESTIDRAKAKINDMSDNMNSTVDSQAETTKYQIRQAVDYLEDKRLTAEDRLKELRQSAGNASDEFLNNVKASWEDLKQAVNDAESRFQ